MAQPGTDSIGHTHERDTHVTVLTPVAAVTANDLCDCCRFDLNRGGFFLHGAVVRHNQWWEHYRAGRAAHGNLRYARLDWNRHPRGPTIRRFPVGGRPERPTTPARGRRTPEPSTASAWRGPTPSPIVRWARLRRAGPALSFHAARLTNDTGGTITSLDISYVGEQWRNGGNATAHTLTFQYQVADAGIITGANAPSTGWTTFSRAELHEPRDRRNGRDAGR